MPERTLSADTTIDCIAAVSTDWYCYCYWKYWRKTPALWGIKWQHFNCQWQYHWRSAWRLMHSMWKTLHMMVVNAWLWRPRCFCFWFSLFGVNNLLLQPWAGMSLIAYASTAKPAHSQQNWLLITSLLIVSDIPNVAHVLLVCNHYNVLRQRYFNISPCMNCLTRSMPIIFFGFIRDIGLYRLL